MKLPTATTEDLRREARESYGRCMICDCSPENPDRELPYEQSSLCVHEIANGQCRQLSYPHRFCWLVLCVWCNLYAVTNKRIWPVARQLCLQRWRTKQAGIEGWHDLKTYVDLIHPNAPLAVTAADLDAHLDGLISELARE